MLKSHGVYLGKLPHYFRRDIKPEPSPLCFSSSTYALTIIQRTHGADDVCCPPHLERNHPFHCCARPFERLSFSGLLGIRVAQKKGFWMGMTGVLSLLHHVLHTQSSNSLLHTLMTEIAAAGRKFLELQRTLPTSMELLRATPTQLHDVAWLAFTSLDATNRLLALCDKDRRGVDGDTAASKHDLE